MTDRILEYFDGYQLGSVAPIASEIEKALEAWAWAAFDLGRERAKSLLKFSAANPADDSDWRRGYNEALKSLLRDAYGIEAKYVPATFTFSDAAGG